MFPHLSCLDLADCSPHGDQLNISILIGADNYWELVTGEIIHHENSPTAINTRLGWVLSGPIEGQFELTTSVNYVSTHVLNVQTQSDDLNSAVAQFWDLKTLGIKDVEPSLYDSLIETIVFKENRYEVRLPWRESHPPLPSNYQLCLRRLNGLIKRLRQDPILLKEYDAVIQEQVNKGIVEAVCSSEIKSDGTTHYIPHHAVIRRDKDTTKLHIVYDTSARSDGPSLNDCLYAGPSFSQSIFDILLRFRLHPVGLIGDIEKAFLMVSVYPPDRDVLRFLWIDSISSTLPEIVVMRFNRVMFGVSSSPFLLSGTIKHHISKYTVSNPEFVKMFLRSIYVDDIIFGASGVVEAFEFYHNSKSKLHEGGFNLRWFFSNSQELMRMIQQAEQNRITPNRRVAEEDESYTKSTLGDHKDTTSEEQKVLGVRWNFVTDELLFDVDSIAKAAVSVELTKRNIVGIASRFYDPLGLISPCTVLFKLLAQRLWESGNDWDTPLSRELLVEWSCLVKCLTNSPCITIPRHCLGNIRDVISCNLQGYCDASCKAYAAVVYLKVSSPTGVHFSLLASKTRVAPSKKHTIPRLELLLALLLARLMTSISQAIEHNVTLGDPLCHTDSRIALYWITSQREWKLYVQNRVNEICKLIQPSFGGIVVELQIQLIYRQGE